MSDKKLLFELHGFKVMSDSIYLVNDKMDYSAPSAFQERGVTKLPSEGVGNTFHCPYKRVSKTDGVWDSGFYDLSPCYSGMEKEKVQIIVENLMKNVVEPFRKAVGKVDALDQHNHEFFDRTSWRVSEGHVFKTNNPVDVVALYFALLNREVVPKHLKGDATFADTAYIIIDINQKMKKRDEDASAMFQAIGVFEALLSQEKEKLDKILYYLGKAMSSDTKVEAYRGMFKAYLESSPSNVETFNKLVKETSSEEGRAKLDIYYALKSRDLKNPKVSKSASGNLYYEDIEIGKDLKGAANRIAKDPEMAGIKRELLFNENEDEE